MQRIHDIETLKSLILLHEKVNYPDTPFCEYLSEKIRKKCSVNISKSTILRFFDLVPSKSGISLSSLNIFCQYLGFKNYSDFVNSVNPEPDKKYIPDEFGLNLFNICLKNHEFKSVIDYIQQLPIGGIGLKRHNAIKESFGTFFRNDRKGRKLLIPELAKIEQGRHYFFESFVDFDYLHQYYSSGLQYYQKHIKTHQPQLACRDFVFSQSVLIIAAIQKRDLRTAKRLSYELFSYKLRNDNSIIGFSHVWPFARYNALHLIYMYLQNNLRPAFLHDTIKRFRDQMSFPSAHFQQILLSELLQALLYCKRFNEIPDVFNEFITLTDSNHSICSSQYNSIRFCLQKAADATKTVNPVVFRLPDEQIKYFNDYAEFKYNYVL